MKHRIGVNVATPKIFARAERSRSHSYPPLPCEGERIEVRGFRIASCSDATLTLTLSLEKGEANGATPLQ